MKIEILEEKENKPLSRKEISFRVEHMGTTTPNRADIKSKIVAQFDADASSVVVTNLYTHFGIGITNGSARIYSNPEQMKRIEHKYVIKRHESKTKEES
ncbi:MAG: 30S ribosomal protein S24e [Candidatus Thorarchaeota archaeon]